MTSKQLDRSAQDEENVVAKFEYQPLIQNRTTNTINAATCSFTSQTRSKQYILNLERKQYKVDPVIINKKLLEASKLSL